MIYDVIILPVAEQDLREINIFYKAINSKLASKFTNTINVDVSRIHNNPFLFQIRFDEIRLAKITGFPYVIHYEIIQNTIIVHGIFHESRDLKSGNKN